MEYFSSSFLAQGFVLGFLLSHLTNVSFGEKMTDYLLVKCVFYKKDS